MRATLDPAQLRISVANRFGSASSCSCELVKDEAPSDRLSHDLTTVDSNDKVIPRFNGNIGVLITQYLKAKGPMPAVSRGLCRRAVGVKAGYEAVESTEHDVIRNRLRFLIPDHQILVTVLLFEATKCLDIRVYLHHAKSRLGSIQSSPYSKKHKISC